jgi:CBS domain-containing protein
MIVSEVMTRDIVAVQPGTSLAEAAYWMVRHHVSGLPVLNDEGRLVGIVTEGDLLRRPELGTSTQQANWLRGFMKTASLAAEYAHTHGRYVGDVMTPNPVFVRPETSLLKAAELMLQKRVKRLPVLQDDALVGVISRFDLLIKLADKLVDRLEEVDDVEIEAAIAAAMKQEPWAPKTGVEIRVKGGIVKLEGRVFSEEEAHALRILVENTSGVIELQDCMEIAAPAPRMGQSAD